MRYATRLDLTDWLASLAARSSLAEATIRQVFAWRRNASYAAWLAISCIYRLVGFDRKSSLETLLAMRDGDTSDLLLMADSSLRIPELVALARMLAERPELEDQVAIVVPDRKVEAAYRPLAGKAKLVSVQRFWLDHRHDVDIHDTAHELLSLFRETIADSGAERVRAGAMFDAVAMHLHTQTVSRLRIASAVRAARGEGARIVVVALDGDFRLQELCWEAMSRADERPVVALTQRGVRGGMRFERVERRFALDALLAAGRAHLARYRDATVETTKLPTLACPPRAPHADQAARKSELALITDALPGSIYWQSVVNLAEAARLEGRKVHALVSRASAARRLRPVCASVEVATVAPGATSGAVFADRYAAFLDVVARVAASKRREKSPLMALAVDFAVAWLATHYVIDTVGYRSFRTSDSLHRWLGASGTQAVVVLPHWSVLAWAALGAARTLDRPTASMPVVTVSGNNASIVEWGGVDLIGCYGAQCEDAFLSLGYPESKLRLVGNLSLDRAMFCRRSAARARHRAYRKIEDRGKRMILYATSGVNKNEADILQAVAKLCREPSANAALVVRPHPSIGHSFYVDCLSQAQCDSAAVYGSGPIHDAISAADVVVTDFSTVGADAVHLRRPLLVVNTTGARFPANNYADMGVAIEANSPAEIAQKLHRLLEEGFWWPGAAASLSRFTEAYNWGGDGASCHRFLRELDAYPERRCAERHISADTH